jgi:hypothetical protein
MSANLSRQVAAHFVGRADAQGMKGRARDRAAVEFLTGAAAAAAVMHGDDSPEWRALSALAFLASCRGYSEVARIAEWQAQS